VLGCCFESLLGDTGGCNETIQEEVGAFDRLSCAWGVGGAVQLKHNTCVRVAIIPGQNSFDDGVTRRCFGSCVDDFRRLADQLAWDMPNGLIILHLDRKKALIFKPGREVNATVIDTALSWAKKHYDALGIAIRTQAGGRIQFGILEVTWYLGQSSRLSFLRHRFLEAIRALGVE